MAARAAVLEMGMNHAGEIGELAAIARPDIGVVTNVGYAHVEFFDIIEGVAAAKRELIEALPREGVAVLNGDDARVRGFRDVHPGRTVTFGFSECADVRAEDVAAERRGGTRFRALGVEFETGLAGRHAVMNLLAAIAVARVFEIAPERLREPVRSFAAGRMRGERIGARRNRGLERLLQLQPEAAQSMIDVLRADAGRRRIAVLGEMLELGHAVGGAAPPGGALRGRAWSGFSDRRERRARGHGGRGGGRRTAAPARVSSRNRLRRANCAATGAAGRRGAVQRFARREGGAGAGDGFNGGRTGPRGR